MKALLLAAAALVVGASAGPRAMNDVQIVGSHNSFKARIPAAVMAKIRATEPKLADGLE